MIGVILAAGAGHRMGVLGERFPKSCLPVGNRPLILRHLDLLRSAGATRIVIVVGFMKEQLIATVGRWERSDIDVRFVEQTERRGIAHALLQTESYVSDRLLVVLADTYFVTSGFEKALRLLDEAHNVAAVLSVRREPDLEQVRRECSVRFDDDGCLLEIVEKPVKPFNDLKPCGVYLFRKAIFDAIRETRPSSVRGEVELTDSIQTLTTTGHQVRAAFTTQWDCNINVPRDLLRANLTARDLLGSDAVAGSAEIAADASCIECVIGSNARVESRASLERVLVLPGARVAEGTTLRDCIVGTDFLLACGEEPCGARSSV